METQIVQCCSKCKETKPVKEFYKNKSSSTGYARYCKECWKKYRDSKKEWWKNYQYSYYRNYRHNMEICEPDRYEERQRLYNSSEWKKYCRHHPIPKNAICGVCNENDATMRHHLLDRKKYPQYLLKSWNIIHICASCHSFIHHAMIRMEAQ